MVNCCLDAVAVVHMPKFDSHMSLQLDLRAQVSNCWDIHSTSTHTQLCIQGFSDEVCFLILLRCGSSCHNPRPSDSRTVHNLLATGLSVATAFPFLESVEGNAAIESGNLFPCAFLYCADGFVR